MRWCHSTSVTVSESGRDARPAIHLLLKPGMPKIRIEPPDPRPLTDPRVGLKSLLRQHALVR
jgi:hypothetical protein